MDNKTPCPFCSQCCDRFGDHVLTCKKVEFYTRHKAVVDLLTRFVKAAKLKVENEVTIAQQKRPADLLIDRWTRGAPVAVDPTITHPLAPGLGLSLEGAMKAVESKAQRKIAKYAPVVSTRRLEFVPFVLSTFGELGSEALNFVDEAAAFYAGAQQTAQCEAAAQLRQRLSVVVAQQVGERLLGATANRGPGAPDDL